MRSRLKAVLFDAGNTLLFLDYDRMATEVGAALDLPLTGSGLAAAAPAAARAMEHARASDQERAAAFFMALFSGAGVPAGRLAEVGACLHRMHREQHLWCSVAADGLQALSRLREGGLRLGVVSNSDGRVEAALEAAGLRPLFDVVVDSTLAGVEKPDPAIFRAALDALGVTPEEAIYVGDLYEVDVVGARAAGLEAVLLAPAGAAAPAGCRSTPSLGALAEELLDGGHR